MNRMTRKIRTKLSIAITAAAALLTLTACGAATQSQQTPASPSPAAQQQVTSSKVTIDNLDTKLEFAEAPKRAVTLNQHATEVMLALGLEKSMVGTAYLDDSILPKYKAQYDKVPVLSDKYPAKEVFLNANPDFAYAGWKSAFTEKTLGTRDELAKLGVSTYLQESSSKPGPTLDDVYRDILNIGRIFRVESRAQELVDGMKKELAHIQSKIGAVDKPLKVFVYDSGDDAPTAAANTYLTNLINKVGGKNVFDDIEKSYAKVSWEEVVSRNPDVIVILDYGSTTAEQKRTLLISKPALADVAAIRNKRILVLPLSAAAEGVRAPIALQTLAAGFYPDKLK